MRLALSDFPERIYNIKDYRAVCSDRLQTEAIQAALDACFLAGGGRVVVPAGVYLTGGALGSVVGVVFTKYGKIATVVTVIAVFLVAGGAGFLAGFSGDERFLAWLTFDGNLPWLILAAGLFIYAIASIPEQRTVWKCNVKM